MAFDIALRDNGPSAFDIALSSVPTEAIASLTATLAPATVTATAAAAAAASLTDSLAPATLSASAAASVAASLTATLSAATLSSSAAAAAVGSLTATLAASTVVASGAASVAASSNTTLGAATLTAQGGAVVAGSLSTTLAPSTLSAAAGASAVAALSGQIAAATLSASASAEVVATLEASLLPTTLAAEAAQPSPANTPPERVFRVGPASRLVVVEADRVVRVGFDARRIHVQPAPRGFIIGPHARVFAITKRTHAMIGSKTKDPDARLDYTLDWSAWLVDGDEIDSVEWDATTGITIGTGAYAPTRTATAATVWLEGGTDGVSYRVSCRITTTELRVDERSFEVRVREA